MELYYFRNNKGNFGDALNGWLWERLIPGAWQPGDGIHVSGIGTIVNHIMPKAPHWVIFGSGVGYGALPDNFGGPDWTVLALRGPLSARALSMPVDTAITDGAMLLSLLPEFSPLPDSERQGTVFMPHYMNPSIDAWREICAECGIEFLDPQSDSVALIHKLRGARLVLADAMHGAIVADTVRTPWVPLSLAPTSNSFKWTDWAMSIELPYLPIVVPFPSSRDATLAALCRFYFEDEYMPGASAETLLQRFAHQSKVSGSSLAQNYRRVAKRASKVAATSVDEITSRLLRDRGARKAACVAALQRATGSRHYLSSDSVFRSRQAAMADKLDQLRRIASDRAFTGDRRPQVDSAP